MWPFSKRRKFESIDEALAESGKYSAKSKWKKAAKVLSRAIDDVASPYGFNERALTYQPIELVLQLPGGASLPRRDIARLFNERGFMHRCMMQFNSARSDYTKAILIDPEYWRPYFNRANLHARDLPMFKEALPDYDIAVSLNPSFADIFNNRGLTYEALNEDDKAMNDFDRAISLNPKYADAHSNKATIFFKRRQYKEAVFWYEKAIELNPKDPELRTNLSLAISKV